MPPALDQGRRYAGQANEPVYRQGRAGGHPQGREYFGVLAQQPGLNVLHAAGGLKRGLDVPDRLGTAGAKCPRRKLHEPVVLYMSTDRRMSSFQ